MLPHREFTSRFDSRTTKYVLIVVAFSATLLMSAALAYLQIDPQSREQSDVLLQALRNTLLVAIVISSIAAWIIPAAIDRTHVAKNHTGETRQETAVYTERAAPPADESLQRAKEAAEQANHAKTRFLTGISHELRTPLQSMLGYAQLLVQKTDIPPQHTKALHVIKRSGDHLASLVEGLLDISKIEAGHLQIYRNEVDLNSLLSQLMTMFEEHARERNIDFRLEVTDQLPELVVADEKRLRQILINLLSNAFKYTAKGSVTLRVRYRNQVAVFSVIDTGVGIDSTDLNRIVGPFERVRNSSVPNIAGTGLGLTIANLLSEIMGGDLSIDSTPGEGSEFRVSLMLPWISRQHQMTQPYREIVGYRGKRMTVMVVDDEPLHRGLVADLLMPIGFNVLESYDAEHCIDMLENAVPDLFLLDISLPGASGLELATELRQQGYDQPIIMLSANGAVRHTRNLWSHTDYDAFIVKPAKIANVLDTFGELLKLEWLHASETRLQNSEERLIQATTQSEPLRARIAREHLLRELVASAGIGYKSGVSLKLEEIAQAEMLPSSTIDRLQELTAALQFNVLAEEVQSLLQEGEAHANRPD